MPKLRNLNRDLLTQFSRAGSYSLVENVFLRLLGLTYLTAFGSLLPQVIPLLGSHGIVPVSRFLLSLRTDLKPSTGVLDPHRLLALRVGWDTARRLRLGLSRFDSSHSALAITPRVGPVLGAVPFSGLRWCSVSQLPMGCAPARSRLPRSFRRVAVVGLGLPGSAVPADVRIGDRQTHVRATPIGGTYTLCGSTS